MQPPFVQQSCAFLFQLLLISCILHFGALQVDAAPTGITSYRSSVVRRQDADSSQPTRVTTVTQINTSNGPVTETCKITLTPITVDGQPQVEEVKDCTVSSGSGGGSSSAAGSDSTTIATSTVASSSADATSTSDGGSSAASTTASAAGASATAGSGPIVNGLSSVPAASAGSATATGSASAAASSATQGSSSASSSAASAASTGKSAATSASALSAATSASAASSGASAGATAAGAVTSQAAFTLPGKKLSVLPIGLGVFAGISVIALIVVGLVTYERTKYRKAFRQRKLAEQGGAMGYGGMVERT